VTTIWKFEIPNSPCPYVTMPRGAQVLSVNQQNGRICVWALVNSKQESELAEFRIYATGENVEMTGACDFVGTVMMPSGLVWHVFRDKPFSY
jgi:hypothetical protein